MTYIALVVPDIFPPVGFALRRWRLLHRVKQGHAADLFNVTQSTVSRWEAGTIAPEPAQARKLWSVLNARLDAAADRALGLLVSESPRPVHLICNATHSLLAASSARSREFGAKGLIGQSLWPFATPEIASTEAHLRNGEQDPTMSQPIVFETGANGSSIVPIRAGRCRWTWMTLSGGSVVRLVETLSA